MAEPQQAGAAAETDAALSAVAAMVAAHAASANLPRITDGNAAEFMPKSLNSFRTADSRAPDNSPPVLWYWQATGRVWDRTSHSYHLAAMQHRRRLQESKAREKEREQRRQHYHQLVDRSGNALVDEAGTLSCGLLVCASVQMQKS